MARPSKAGQQPLIEISAIADALMELFTALGWEPVDQDTFQRLQNG
jgi:hypothetical protein